jgi:hypothetical protein
MPKTYITSLGDFWDGIALKELGSEMHAGLLMDLNREYLDVVTFEAGVELTLPDVAPDLPSTLPPWKREAVV